MRTVTLIAALLALTAPAAAQAPTPAAAPAPVTTIIHAGRLLAVPGRAARGPSTIVVRDGRIAEVRDGFADVTGARVIDLRDQYVLPGLIDLHVHMGSNGEQLKSRLEFATNNREDNLVAAIRNARLDLMAGFTTVRDLGGYAPMVRALKRGIAEGVIEGPTIVMAGRMVSVTGGHGDVNGLNEEITDAYKPHATHVCDGADDCRRATRQQIADGAEVIKFASTGGVGSNVAGGLGRQMQPEEMRAIVETAHLWGRPVTAHSHGVEGINGALEAGVDSIKHGTYADDRSFALYKKTGARWVPTMLAPQAINEAGKRGELTPAATAKAAEVAGQVVETFRRAVKAGVPIAFGTDTGVSRHGIGAQEFALMTGAGMVPAEAIRTATVEAAAMLRRSDRLGTIEPGKDADIIAVAGDPVEDVRRLEQVRFVMRQGRVHKLGGEAAR